MRFMVFGRHRFLVFAGLCGGMAQGALAVAATAAEFCVTCDGPAAQYTCKFDDTVTDSSDPKLKLYCITELARLGPHASCSVDRSRMPPCAGEVRMLTAPHGLGIGGIDIEARSKPGETGTGGNAGTGESAGGHPAVMPQGTGHDGGGMSAAPRSGGLPGAPDGTAATRPERPGASPPAMPDAIGHQAPRATPGAAAQADGNGTANGMGIGNAAAPGDMTGTAGKSPEFSTNEPPKTVQEMVEKSSSSTGKALKKTGEAATDAAEKTGSAIQNAGKAVGNAAKKTWKCIMSLFGDC